MFQQNSKTDLVIDRQSNLIRLTRMLTASKEKTFEAWTQPEHLSQWWDPDGDPLALCQIDLKKGGSFKFVTKSRPDIPFSGKYLEIEPPDKLIFDCVEGIGRVFLSESNGKTLMIVEIQCSSAEHLKHLLELGADQGTGMTLDNLVKYLSK